MFKINEILNIGELSVPFLLIKLSHHNYTENENIRYLNK